MGMRVWAPRRPHPAPVTGTVLGSLTAHVALVVAVVGGEGSNSAPTNSDTAMGAAIGGRGGEQMLWVGVRGEPRPGGGAPPPGTRPPSAYVVPGRGGARHRTPGLAGPHDPTRPAAGQAETPPVLTVRRPSPRRTPLALHLPTVTMPDPEATPLLIAGVLSAAPDLTRQVSRPEDFAPPPDAMDELGARTGGRSPDALWAMRHVDDLPIPLVSNPPPSYPLALARAHVDGQVVVEFTIDSTGVVDLGSLRVVQSTNVLFTQAVRRVLPRLRFMPAQLRERAVGVTVRQPFLFTVRSGL